jgi:hypothetical protein
MAIITVLMLHQMYNRHPSFARSSLMLTMKIILQQLTNDCLMQQHMIQH